MPPKGSPPTYSRKWTPYEPEENEWLMWKHKEHAIYDAFPDGNAIDADAIGLDFNQPLWVVNSTREMCWRQLKSKSKSWIICHYVAVKFEHTDPDGNTACYYSTFGRDVETWMWTWEEWNAM
jgi:hypothetical protein